MTLPSSGPISLNDLNVEFGLVGTSSLSLSQSFAGTVAQYGNINRNTTAGRQVFTTFTGSTDFGLTNFYDYNDVENNYWDWTFDATSYDHDSEVNVYIGANNIIQTLVYANSSDASGGYVDTTTSATTGANLSLQFTGGPPRAGSVDILVTDPDTLATIFSDIGGDSRDYASETVLATIYGYQRFNFSIIFYN